MCLLLQVAGLKHYLSRLFELAICDTSSFETALFVAFEQAYKFEHQCAYYLMLQIFCLSHHPSLRARLLLVRPEFRHSPIRCLLANLLIRAVRLLLQIARLQHLPSLFEITITVTSCLRTAFFDAFELALFEQCASYFRSLV